MLIVGDILAVRTFRQHARWDYIRRLLPPAVLGVIAGALLVQRISEAQYKPLIGVIILGRVGLGYMFTKGEANSAQERVRRMFDGLKAGGNRQQAIEMWSRIFLIDSQCTA